MPFSSLFGSTPNTTLTDPEPLPTDKDSRPIKTGDSFVNAAIAYVLVRTESTKPIKPQVDFGYHIDDCKYFWQSSPDLPHHIYHHTKGYLTDGVCHKITPKAGIPIVARDTILVRLHTWNLDEAVEEMLAAVGEYKADKHSENFSIEWESVSDEIGGRIAHISRGGMVHVWWEIVHGVIDYDA